MSDGGWIKLYRKIRKSFVWTNSDQLKLWLLVLMKANHEPNKFLFNGKEVSVTSGQFVTGAHVLASEFNEGVPRDKAVAWRSLWRWLKRFENEQMLTIKSNTKYSVITVLHWDEYQSVDNQVTSTRQSTDNQVTTNKNEKNEKKEKNIYDDGKLNPFELWQKTWGFPNAVAQQDLIEWRNQFDDELVSYAITEAGRYNVQPKGADKYLNRVFEGYKERNIRTVKQAKEASIQHQERMKNQYDSSKWHQNKLVQKESLPDWAENQPTETKPMDPDAQAKLQKRLKVLRRRNDERT